MAFSPFYYAIFFSFLYHFKFLINFFYQELEQELLSLGEATIIQFNLGLEDIHTLLILNYGKYKKNLYVNVEIGDQTHRKF